MKRVILVAMVLAVTGCASAPTGLVVAPWECYSSVEPIDAPVLRFEKGVYIYDCNMNGDGDSGNGEGDGEGDGAE